MIVALPTETPVTTPVPEPTVATEGVLLIHVPPVEVVANVVDEPLQTLVAPVIGFGETFIVMP